jgi:thioredoxin 1
MMIEHRFFNAPNNIVEVLSMSVKRVLAIITVILSIFLFVAAVAPSFSAELKNIPVKGKVTLVDLGAASCIPCKMMAPILDKLAKRYEGKAAVVFIDLRYSREAIQQFGVMGIPTQIFFDKNGREISRHLGFMSEEAIVAQLKSMGVQ